MKRREILNIGVACLAGAPFVRRQACAAVPAGGLELATWGGLWGAAMARYVDQPFSQQTGASVTDDFSSTPVERIQKIKMSQGDQVYDVVQLHDGIVPLAEAEGVLEPLDETWPELSNMKDIPQRYKRLGWVGMAYSALGIAYNPKLVGKPPRSFADLWSNTYRGMIVLPEVSHSLGLYIVPIGALAAGRPVEDTEAGFKMLERMVALDPIWARDTDSIMNALASEEAVIGLLYKSQVETLKQKGKNIEWIMPQEGGISYVTGTGIAKNSKNIRLAARYLNMTITAEYQRFVSEIFSYEGTNPGVASLLTPEVRQRCGFSADERSKIIDLDQEWMAHNRVAWADRWNRVVSGG
ncbi:extracellular solute-binding protein [Acetobacter sp. TBRC 12305]|uniref:Extracellular solute-binding protein n=1 Tax=Acetobacter garciniae TaxID=2817435 RepID=A0A939KQ98_9PROT|nr:extracellular solute-binding protein [Acetobacter garciniae]MBO1325089.1 extracellular solute-binding protein [Acetobacter garciniae]MBX0344940.1 extracellular solute-binding protein [Acetobacter garciniae]